MGRLVLAAAAAAVVMHIWGMAWWMALPFADQVLYPLDDQNVALTLGDATTRSGAYYFPVAPNDDYQDEAFVQRHKAGPVGLVFIQKESREPMSGGMIGKGFVHYFVVSLLLAFVLSMASSALQTYWRRVGLVAFAGLSGIVFSNLAYPIWWHHDPGFWMMTAVYEGLGVTLAGLVLAAIIKPKPSV